VCKFYETVSKKASHPCTFAVPDRGGLAQLVVGPTRNEELMKRLKEDLREFYSSISSESHDDDIQQDRVVPTVMRYGPKALDLGVCYTMPVAEREG
jgi:hypothetical protein